MTVQKRNNVQVSGDGPATIVFAHGFGCDQTMWRYLYPSFESRYRTILFDLTGCGLSDQQAYDHDKYANLHGHAKDLIEIIDEFAHGPVVFVGHSVSATIGALASISAPERFRALVMVGPSPCFLNDGDYAGGFSRQEIDALLDTLEANYLAWASAIAPALMGVNRPDLGVELANAMHRVDPDIAKHFARITFLADHRADLPKVNTPTLIVQSSSDFLVPVGVAEYMCEVMPRASLMLIENDGHCPHLSAPLASLEATEEFIRQLSL